MEVVGDDGDGVAGVEDEPSPDDDVVEVVVDDEPPAPDPDPEPSEAVDERFPRLSVA